MAGFVARRVTGPLAADPQTASADLYFEFANRGAGFPPGPEGRRLAARWGAPDHAFAGPGSAVVYDFQGRRLGLRQHGAPRLRAATGRRGEDGRPGRDPGPWPGRGREGGHGRSGLGTVRHRVRSREVDHALDCRLALRLRVVVAALAISMVVGVRVARERRWTFPEFAPPLVEIQTEAPGLSTEEVESLVTVPIENALNGMPG